MAVGAQDLEIRGSYCQALARARLAPPPPRPDDVVEIEEARVLIVYFTALALEPTALEEPQSEPREAEPVEPGVVLRDAHLAYVPECAGRPLLLRSPQWEVLCTETLNLLTVCTATFAMFTEMSAHYFLWILSISAHGSQCTSANMSGLSGARVELTTIHLPTFGCSRYETKYPRVCARVISSFDTSSMLNHPIEEIGSYHCMVTGSPRFRRTVRFIPLHYHRTAALAVVIH